MCALHGSLLCYTFDVRSRCFVMIVIVLVPFSLLVVGLVTRGRVTMHVCGGVITVRHSRICEEP